MIQKAEGKSKMKRVWAIKYVKRQVEGLKG